MSPTMESPEKLKKTFTKNIPLSYGHLHGLVLLPDLPTLLDSIPLTLLNLNSRLIALLHLDIKEQLTALDKLSTIRESKDFIEELLLALLELSLLRLEDFMFLKK